MLTYQPSPQYITVLVHELAIDENILIHIHIVLIIFSGVTLRCKIIHSTHVGLFENGIITLKILQSGAP